MTDSDFPVLIVGGSLVGLSAATLLAQLGISSLTVERHSGTAIHPRAAHASQRTLEVFRSVGLEAPVCERSAQQFVQNGGIVAVKTLAGGTTQEFIADLNAGVRDVSPSERVFLAKRPRAPPRTARKRAWRDLALLDRCRIGRGEHRWSNDAAARSPHRRNLDREVALLDCCGRRS